MTLSPEPDAPATNVARMLEQWLVNELFEAGCQRSGPTRVSLVLIVETESRAMPGTSGVMDKDRQMRVTVCEMTTAEVKAL